jgi:hypothetical protein
MAASPHSWDFLLLRLRELRLPLLRGSASRTSEPTAKSIADILPPRDYQSKISGSASPPIYRIGSSMTARFTVHHNEHVSSQPFEAGRRHSLQGYRLTQPVVQMMLPLLGSTAQEMPLFCLKPASVVGSLVPPTTASPQNSPACAT